MTDLRAVGDADHIVVEDDTAEPGELGAASLKWILRAPPGLLGAHAVGTGLELIFDFLVVRLVESAIRPVAVRAEDCRQPTCLARGPVEVAGHVMAWASRAADPLDG